MKLVLEIDAVTATLYPDGVGVWIQLPNREIVRLPLTDEGAAKMIAEFQKLTATPPDDWEPGARFPDDHRKEQ